MTETPQGATDASLTPPDAPSRNAIQEARGCAARARPRRPQMQAWGDSARDEMEDENSWLMSFGDLMSLLLVLFVFLVAFANFEPGRHASGTEPRATGDAGRESAAQRPAEPTPEPKAPPRTLDDSPPPELDPALKALGKDVEIKVQQGQINLQIPDSILFAAGTATLSEAGQPLLDRIAAAFQGNSHDISIEGHTDSMPIQSARFPSNWELSSARAAMVLRYFIARGIDPRRMRAIGYADTRPLVPNDSPDSRARNRRVELILHVKPPHDRF